jgi:hypothetical protein
MRPRTIPSDAASVARKRRQACTHVVTAINLARPHEFRTIYIGTSCAAAMRAIRREAARRTSHKEQP